MVFVFTIFAVGLAYAAYCERGKGARLFLLACCILNLACIFKAVSNNDPYAYKLKPNDGINEPSYRR
jgi:hypothetical protein